MTEDILHNVECLATLNSYVEIKGCYKFYENFEETWLKDTIIPQLVLRKDKVLELFKINF